MKAFSILGGKAHVVELPEGAKFPRIETNQSIIPYSQDLCWYRNGGEKSYGMDETECVGLPQGNWQIVGRLSDVNWDESDIGYLESDILADGYTFQSEPKPENKDFYWGYLDDLAKWDAAQQRVLSRECCLLLRRADL